MRSDKSHGFAGPDLLDRRHARAALLVSALSVAWTIAAGGLAITIGVRSQILVLVAFGAVGLVDAIGSLALVYHFQHGLRHDRLSRELETISHRVVLVGLFTVGCAAVLGGLVRLGVGHAGDSSDSAVALAAISAVALAALSTGKLQIARRVSSKALLTDGYLSAIGATQAAVALAGTALTRWLHLQWTDATATIVVGSVATWIAVFTWRSEHAHPARPGRELSFTAIALLWLAIVALLDALLGPRLILIGLLVGGPAVAAVACRSKPVIGIGAIAIALSVVLGAPDQIWLTTEHAIWIAAIVVVSITNATVVTAVAPVIKRQAAAL